MSAGSNTSSSNYTVRGTYYSIQISSNFSSPASAHTGCDGTLSGQMGGADRVCPLHAQVLEPTKRISRNMDHKPGRQAQVSIIMYNQVFTFSIIHIAVDLG